MDVLKPSANARIQPESCAAARSPSGLNLGATAGAAAAVPGQTARFAARTSRRARRGVAVLWLILAMPVLLLLVGFVLEIGNLWLARVQLENALESAALAAVKEWADAGGGDTQTARLVGLEYAAANRVTGTPVSLLDNYAIANINQNASSAGNLLFGALTHDAIPWVFNAGIQPSCGLGEVLFDASSGSSLQDAGAWGINFHPATALTPAGLTISRVEIDLRIDDPDADFAFGTNPPVISNRLAGDPNSKYVAPNSQDDTFGLDSGGLTFHAAGTVSTWENTQVRFTYDTTLPGRLVIDFFDDNTTDPHDGEYGFEPGDRIRFGAQVVDLSQGVGNNDGDGVGRERVQVLVTFAIFGTDQAPASAGYFRDSQFAACSTPNRELPPVDLDPCIAGNAPYVLPQGDASSKTNDHQSYAIVGGAGGNPFAVRAQASIAVNSLCSNLLGISWPVFHVSATSTARNDCTAAGSRLIRVRPEHFIYPGP